MIKVKYTYSGGSTFRSYPTRDDKAAVSAPPPSTTSYVIEKTHLVRLDFESSSPCSSMYPTVPEPSHLRLISRVKQDIRRLAFPPWRHAHLSDFVPL